MLYVATETSNIPIHVKSRISGFTPFPAGLNSPRKLCLSRGLTHIFGTIEWQGSLNMNGGVN